MRRRSFVLVLAFASPAFAADVPPWNDTNDVPVPDWVRSVTPATAESAIYAEPGRIDLRRGSAQPGAHLSFFGTRRAPNCLGRWLNVGPLAWMCSDVGEYTPDEPAAPLLGTRPWPAPDGEDRIRPKRPGATSLPPLDPGPNDDGLPYRYYFAGRDGAYGFSNLANAADDAPDQDLEAGFAVAAVEERTEHGEKWIKTKKGYWVALRELGPARPNLFHGELPKDEERLAWVVADKASTYPGEKPEKPNGTRVRFEKVTVAEEKGAMVKTSEGAWMRAKDLAVVHKAPPPPEVTGDQRWIDVDLAQQTLVAYEGPRAVFATIVSTGKGPGAEFTTHTGTFHIWVKIFTTKMDNLDKDDVDRHYAIEDVPYVQFFDKAIALHGAFWHRDFGRVHSHGCVNLAPIDARWLFAFTGPHLPNGWAAVLPTKVETGTIVRVR